MLFILLLGLISYLKSFEIQVDRISDNNTNLFIPTSKWKVVHRGQVLPPGLHVRQNIQTGIVEAKLMDNNSDTLDTGSDKRTDSTSLLELKLNSSVPTPKVKFRSYEELKANFEKMNVNVKTDAEIIDDLVGKLRTENITVEKMLLHLEDLAYLLHQIDNARNFVKIYGFSLIISFLHHTDQRVQLYAFRTLASAIQGNFQVKLEALNAGIINHIHRILKSVSTAENTNQTSDFVSAGLVTLGALLRDFPVAQKHFFSPLLGLSPAGFDLLIDVVNLEGSFNHDGRNLRVMALTLLSDLYNERLIAEQNAKSDPTETNHKFWDLYSSIPFEEYFVLANWCDKVHYSFIHDVQSGVQTEILTTPVNHDRREKLITISLNFAKLCHYWNVPTGYKFEEMLSKLQLLEAEYVVRARSEIDEDDDTDTYFRDLLKNIQQLISILTKANSELNKDEL